MSPSHQRLTSLLAYFMSDALIALWCKVLKCSYSVVCRWV